MAEQLRYPGKDGKDLGGRGAVHSAPAAGERRMAKMPCGGFVMSETRTKGSEMKK